MKKVIEHVRNPVSRVFREMRLFVALFGALGFFFSCTSAATGSGGPSPTWSFEAADITATFGSVEGTIEIDETNIMITGLRNYDDRLMLGGAPLEFTVVIDDTSGDFTVDTSSLTLTIRNDASGVLVGTGAMSLNLGTLTVTANGESREYDVAVQFVDATLGLRVSGQVELDSGSTYFSIVESVMTTEITEINCSDDVLILRIYEGTTLSRYTTSFTTGSPSMYVYDSMNSASNMKTVRLDVSNGNAFVATFGFSYTVKGCASGDIAGDGTEGNPYLIPSAATLNLVSALVDSGTNNYRSAHYEVTADIDLGLEGAPWAESSGGAGLLPIGKGALNAAFTGSFNCADKTLSNLFINRGSTDNIGLIGVLRYPGSVMNCTLVNAKVTGSNKVGILIGHQDSGTISASAVTGTVTGTTYVGGLVGDSSGTINDSTATVSVTGSGKVGGLAGSGATIRGSTAGGTVMGNSEVGGLVGSGIHDSTISDSHATGDVTGSGEFVGGLVGNQPISGGAITGSTATGDVMGSNNYVGGLVGNGTGEIENSYATGNVTGMSNSVGGLAGRVYKSIISSYATGDVLGSNYVGGLVGNIGAATIVNAYSRGEVSLSSGSTGTNSGGLIGYSTNNTSTDPSVTNSYTVSTGGRRSFIGTIHLGTTLTVTNSYALESTDGLGFTVDAGDTSSEQSRDALKSGAGLYTNWNTDVWDFGTATELPTLKGLPNESSQARD